MPAPIVNGEDAGKLSNFEGLMTLTVTLHQVIRHNVVYQSLSSTYIPSFT